MNYWIENKRKDLHRLLKHIDVFLLNESEARKLTSETNIIKAARRIEKMGPGKVIIKKGENGVVMFSGNKFFSIPAFLLESIFDPTGAGDTFAGGFLGYLASCGSLAEVSLRGAVMYGCVMATFAVEDFSLRRLGSITKKDINKRFNQFKKQMHF